MIRSSALDRQKEDPTTLNLIPVAPHSQICGSLTMRLTRPRSRPHFPLPKKCLLLFSGLGLLLLSLASVDLPAGMTVPTPLRLEREEDSMNKDNDLAKTVKQNEINRTTSSTCATVEDMGDEAVGDSWKESLRVRRLIRDHFALHGTSRVRGLPPEQFCRQGFVMGKASEAGFGNEMYKILTAAGLSIMLNRSLIVGKTRGKYPFENYISYNSFSFTLREVKHLWRKNDCVGKYGRRLVMRTDDFEKPAETNVLCSNWRKWKQPIIWFKGTTDAVAAQFFLKNVHPQMRRAAATLFGKTDFLHSRPNVIGELMRVLISPTADVEEAVNWALDGGPDPHIAVHMRMLMNRSVRAVTAALNCIKTTITRIPHHVSRPRVVLVSDTPSLVIDIIPKLQEFAEVIHFDYKKFKGNISGSIAEHGIGFRAKDWGPAPRWVAFVDFFLASRARHAVVTGAHKRVGTTYAQLIAAMAAAHQLDEGQNRASKFSFISSFQRNLLYGGLQNQVGWGHVWNRYAGPLSCRKQPNQCALTPLVPPGWWDGIWQSPIPRDIRRMEAYGVKLMGLGTIDENHLQSFCKSRKGIVRTIPITRTCNGLTCA